MRRLEVLVPYACLLLGLGVAGCGDTLPVQSFVEKLRVLGVRAEPPEIAPGETTTLDALVVQPPTARATAPKAVSYLWVSCSVPPGVGQLAPCGVNDLTAVPPSCALDPGAPICVLGDQATATYTASATTVGSDGTGQRLITMVVSETDGGAVGCLLDTAQNKGIPTDPDHCVLTLKRLVVSSPTVTPASNRNRNPTLRTLDLHLVDDQDMLGAARSLLDGAARYTVAPDKKKPTWRLTTERNEDASEQKSDGRYEELSVAWYISAGKLAGARAVFEDTSCQGDGCNRMPPPLQVDADWTAPTSAERAEDVPTGGALDGLTEFWAVVRDDRGGIGWLYGTARPE